MARSCAGATREWIRSRQGSPDLRELAIGVLWSLAGLRIVTCAFRALHDERELRGEAALLLNQVCDIPRSHAVGSTLIRCDEAKAVLAQGPLWLVSLERTLSYIVLDTLAAARREVWALINTLTMFGFLAAGAVLALQVWAARRRTRRWEFDQIHAASDMFKARTSAVVPLRFEEAD